MPYFLPDGFRFSEKTTRPDWTEEILTEIKAIYRRYTNPGGSTQVKLQGLVWDSKGGGLIPLENYLAATLAYRDRGASQKHHRGDRRRTSSQREVSSDLLGRAEWPGGASLLLVRLRKEWRAARITEVPHLAAEIRQWQGALTRFGSVGHFKPWQQPVNPLAESQSFRLKLAPAPGATEVVLRLVSRDAGDGPAGKVVEWKEPRLESVGTSACAY